MGEDLRESRKSVLSHKAGESIIALGLYEIESLDTGPWLDSEDRNISSPEGANILYDDPDVNGTCAGVATLAIEFLWYIGWAPDKSSPFWYE
jgi:hypothetical protein